MCPLREVSLFRTHGQIEQERLNGDLLANSLDCENTHQQGCLQNEYAVLKICSMFCFLIFNDSPRPFATSIPKQKLKWWDVPKPTRWRLSLLVSKTRCLAVTLVVHSTHHRVYIVMSYDYDCTVCYIPHILHSSTHVITNLTCHRSES